MRKAAPAAGIAPAARAVRERTIRWGQPPVTFELESSEDEVLRRAQVVFRPWRDAGTGAPARRWRVERSASGAWEIHDFREPRPFESATVESAVRTVEYHAITALIDAAGTTTLHAALVARGELGVAILGPAESGKSTLATALWRSGFSLLGDDVTVVDPDTTRAWPAPRRVALRSASRALLGEALWRRIQRSPSWEATSEGCVFHPDEATPGPRPSSVRLTTLVFLGRRGVETGPAEARPLAAAHALLALLPYTNAIRRDEPGAVIHRLSPLLSRLAAYDLGRGPLEAMIARVERELPESTE